MVIRTLETKTVIISSICMMAVFAIVFQFGGGENVVIVENRLTDFPFTLRDYSGTDIELSGAVLKELNTDGYVFRQYRNENGNRINLYLGYYGTQKGGRTGHNPESCYPGSGWGVVDKNREKLRVTFNGKDKNIDVNVIVVQSGSTSELVYHWYQTEKDIVLPSGISQNFMKLKTMILKNRNDGAFIRVSTPFEGNSAKAKKRVENFIKVIFPLIAANWPIEEG